MRDPILARLYELGFEPMDIDKDLTVSDCCIKYKNRLPYNIQIGNDIYDKPNCRIIKELVILTTEKDRRIFKKGSKGYSRYLVIKGQELLGVYEQYKSEGKQDFFHGYTIPIKWEYITPDNVSTLQATYGIEVMKQIKERLKKL